MMHKIMMILVIVLLAVGGYFGYQRYMNQDNVMIQGEGFAQSAFMKYKAHCDDDDDICKSEVKIQNDTGVRGDISKKYKK